MLVQLLEDDRDFITGIHSPKSLRSLGPCEDLRKAEKLKKKATDASILLLSLGFFSYMHLRHPYISFYLPLRRTFSVYV